MKIKSIATLAAMLVVHINGTAFGQSNLNFTAITATVEGNIQLSWRSSSNEIYEIDEADALNTNSDGTTFWNMLYSDCRTDTLSASSAPGGSSFYNSQQIWP